MNNVVKSGTDVEELGYQFASQALIIYQDELTDSEAKYRAITFILGTLQKATFFSSDNYETLITNAIQYCPKLLPKSAQCLATLHSSHLFCSEALVTSSLLHRPERARASRETDEEGFNSLRAMQDDEHQRP